MTAAPTKWEFAATCDTCGVVIPTQVLGTEFRQTAEHIEYVVVMERTEVEAHALTHEVVL